MTNAFEYGDALLPPSEPSEDGNSAPIASNQPYLNLATSVLPVPITVIILNAIYFSCH